METPSPVPDAQGTFKKPGSTPHPPSSTPISSIPAVATQTTVSPFWPERLAPGRMLIVPPREDLLEAFERVRAFTLQLCEPLETEDFVVQTMPDVSPTKWHIAHTTWFFEVFVLNKFVPRYTPVNDQYHYLFNSYYNTLGARHCRPRRGLLSRPTVAQVMEYRRLVEERLLLLLDSCGDAAYESLAPLVVLGLNHEQQHQELMLTDLLHVFSANPLRPAFREISQRAPHRFTPLEWKSFSSTIAPMGVDPNTKRFYFDNEGPRHKVLLQDFQLANRPVTCGEFLEFIEDKGYQNANHWLSEGWSVVLSQKWEAPFHWRKSADGWRIMTLAGELPLDPNAPACHLSFFEADAFARWAGCRLPTEFEWEFACGNEPITGCFAESLAVEPRLAENSPGLHPFGGVWEWTASPYLGYPGFQPAAGAVGEYNGKFMCNQFVLRGGSLATSQSHMRPTYRNFFPADAQWQFTGVRLAK
ncbi:MAG: ergothioneine biosynthesis protein EgtB [Candidatus Sumerlaeia bacterium]|nr:ergothioneine biosynthesis protein EgtB [Candidatus Sumerlaeia bacterium]